MTLKVKKNLFMCSYNTITSRPKNSFQKNISKNMRQENIYAVIETCLKNRREEKSK